MYVANFRNGTLDLAMLKEVVLLAAPTVGALETAHQQQRDGCGDYQGHQGLVDRDPMDESVHIERLHTDCT
jgi:hypothetical protein